MKLRALGEEGGAQGDAHGATLVAQEVEEARGGAHLLRRNALVRRYRDGHEEKSWSKLLEEARGHTRTPRPGSRNAGATGRKHVHQDAHQHEKANVHLSPTSWPTMTMARSDANPPEKG